MVQGSRITALGVLVIAFAVGCTVAGGVLLDMGFRGSSLALLLAGEVLLTFGLTLDAASCCVCFSAFDTSTAGTV